MRLAHRAEAYTADGLFVELGRIASAAAEQQRTNREHENDTDDDTDLDHPVAELLKPPIAEILRAALNSSTKIEVSNSVSRARRAASGSLHRRRTSRGRTLSARR